MRPFRPWLHRTHLAASVLGVLLFVATLIEPQWIERLVGDAPDAGDGSLERWLVSGAFLVAAVLAALLARRERARMVR
jgi:hypothetical protein